MNRNPPKGPADRPATTKGVRKMGFVFVSIGFLGDELFEASCVFRQSFGVQPNLLSAGVRVDQEIDDVARTDQDSVEDPQGRHPKPGEEVELSGFHTDSCETLFTLNDMTLYPGFVLIFDEDPSFDGEEEPVFMGQVRALRYRVA